MGAETRGSHRGSAWACRRLLPTTSAFTPPSAAPLEGWVGPAGWIVESTSTAAGSDELPAGESALSAKRSRPSSRDRPRDGHLVSPPLGRIFHRTNPA